MMMNKKLWLNGLIVAAFVGLVIPAAWADIAPFPVVDPNQDGSKQKAAEPGNSSKVADKDTAKDQPSAKDKSAENEKSTKKAGKKAEKKTAKKGKSEDSAGNAKK